MQPGLSTGDDPFSAGQGGAQSLTDDVPSNLSHIAPTQPAEGLSGLGARLDRQPSPSSARQRSRIVYPYPLVIIALLDIGYAVFAAREGQHIPAPLVTFTVARAFVLIGIMGCSRRWRFRGGWVGMVCAISIGAAVWEACRGVLMRRVIPPEQEGKAVKGFFLAITAAIALLEYLLFLLLVRLSPPVRQSGGTRLRLPTSRDARLFTSISTRGRHSGAGSLSSPARSRRRGQGGSALSTPARNRPSRQQRHASAVSWLAEQAVHNTRVGAGGDRLLSPSPVGPSLVDPFQADHEGQPRTPRRGDQTPATATTFSPRFMEQSSTGIGGSSHTRVASDTAEETGIAFRNDETSSLDDEDPSTEFGSFDQSDDPDNSEDEDDDADSASSISESSIIDLPPPLQPSRILPPSLSMNGGLSSLADRSPILRPLVRRSRSARFLGRSWGSRGASGDGSDDGDAEARAEGYGTFRQR